MRKRLLQILLVSLMLTAGCGLTKENQNSGNFCGGEPTLESGMRVVLRFGNHNPTDFPEAHLDYFGQIATVFQNGVEVQWEHLTTTRSHPRQDFFVELENCAQSAVGKRVAYRGAQGESFAPFSSTEIQYFGRIIREYERQVYEIEWDSISFPTAEPVRNLFIEN